MNDRLSDQPRTCRPRSDRRLGRSRMTAEVLRFISPPDHRAQAATDFPTIAFRAVVEVEDFASARADTAPSEIVPFACDEP
jgi:hypothetical protein